MKQNWEQSKLPRRGGSESILGGRGHRRTRGTKSFYTIEKNVMKKVSQGTECILKGTRSILARLPSQEEEVRVSISQLKKKRRGVDEGRSFEGREWFSSRTTKGLVVNETNVAKSQNEKNQHLGAVQKGFSAYSRPPGGGKERLNEVETEITAAGKGLCGAVRRTQVGVVRPECLPRSGFSPHQSTEEVGSPRKRLRLFSREEEIGEVQWACHPPVDCVTSWGDQK